MKWNWVKEVVDAAVNLADKAFPLWVGKRTAVAVVACPVLAVASPFLKGLVPDAAPAVDVVQSVLCAAAPVTGLAHLLRK